MGWSMVEHAQKSSKKATTSAFKEKHFSRCGGAIIGTNQIAELTAVLIALRTYSSRSPRKAQQLVIETDSNYALKSATEWIGNWKTKNWRNSKREVVTNLALMKALDNELVQRESDGGEVKFIWVKGHAGNLYNELADEIANQQAQKFRQSGSYDARNYPGDDVFQEIPAEALAVVKERFYPHCGQGQLELL
jgi:ribonuclease HI